MLNAHGVHVTVSKSSVSVNTGTGGGALVLEFAAMNSSKLMYTAQFTATHFVGNLGVADGMYGAVYVTQQDTFASPLPVVTVDNCKVSGNNGGLGFKNLGKLSIAECRFFENGLPTGELLRFLIIKALQFAMVWFTKAE